MIALPDGLPLLRLERGLLIPFREEWLTSSLLHAASDAGHEKWWPAREVSRSVTAYLRQCHEDPTISLPKVERAIRQVLETLGFPEIGDHFTPDPPIVQIDLSDLAQRAGPGCFLVFFHLLTDPLKSSRSVPRQQIEVVGLRQAVKLLLSRDLWSKSCCGLEREIIGYIRDLISRGGPAVTLRATIS